MFTRIPAHRPTMLWRRCYTSGSSVPKRRGRPVLIGVATVLGVGYIVDNQFYSSTITRSVRALYVLTSVALQYKYTTSWYENQNDLHEKASQQLYDLLAKTGGLYIKFGQAIANQGAAFPMAYQKRFAKLYDDAPAEPWAKVHKSLSRSLGPDFESEVFSEISHEAVASGSIAQVHKAVLKESGEQVAVKVQHDSVSHQVAADLFVYRLMSRVYSYMLDFPLSTYSRYISDQTFKETLFDNELENAEKLRAFLQNDPSVKNLDIYIPQNYRQYSDEKVLVSEWIDGVSLSDKNRIVEQKYDLTRMMHQFITVFGKQIYSYGFVHSDAHPGNLLVRRHKGRQQLVLLDHGLYIELNPKFKLEYCQLWRGMFSFDKERIKTIAEGWGIKSVDMFATMVQLSPMDDNGDIQKLQRTSSREMLSTFLSDSTKLPLELSFLGKTMRIIQTTNKTFGSPVNRINTLTNEAVSSLIKHSSIDSEWLNLLKLKTSLFISTLVFLFVRLKQILRGDRLGTKGLGLEDYMDAYFKKTARDAGFEMFDE